MRGIAAVGLAWAIGVVPGCVRRTIHVTSDPPGAVVWINDVEVGRTPVSTSFVYYGVYDVRLWLDGYEPWSGPLPARMPLWEYPGPDLVAEALPTRARSDVRWHVELHKTAAGGDEAAARGLEGRARALRERVDAAPQAEDD